MAIPKEPAVAVHLPSTHGSAEVLPLKPHASQKQETTCNKIQSSRDHNALAIRATDSMSVPQLKLNKGKDETIRDPALSHKKRTKLQKDKKQKSSKHSRIIASPSTAPKVAEKRMTVEMRQPGQAQSGIRFPWNRPHKGQTLEQLHGSGFFTRIELPKKRLVRTPAALVVPKLQSCYRPPSMLLTPTVLYKRQERQTLRASRLSMLKDVWVTAAVLESLHESRRNRENEASDVPDTYDIGALTTVREADGTNEPQEEPARASRLAPSGIVLANTVGECETSDKWAAAVDSDWTPGCPDTPTPTPDDSTKKSFETDLESPILPPEAKGKAKATAMEMESEIESAVQADGGDVSQAPYRHGPIRVEREASIRSCRASSVVGLESWDVLPASQDRRDRDEAVIESILEFFAHVPTASAVGEAESGDGGARQLGIKTANTPPPRPSRPESAPVLDAYLASQNNAIARVMPTRTTTMARIAKSKSLPTRVSLSGKRLGGEPSASRPSSLATLLSWKRALF